MAVTLGNWAHSFKTKDETTDIVEASLKIGRIGLNLLRMMEPKAPIEYRLTSIKTLADLCMTVGLSLESMNRPMACLEYLDRAEQHYKQYMDRMPFVSDQDRIICESMYEYCRGKEAEAWYRMVNDIPEKDRANYLLFSKSYLVHSLIRLSLMGNEEFVKDLRNVMHDVDILSEKYGMPDASIIENELFPKDVDEYRLWCFDKVLIINFYCEVPSLQAEHLEDEVTFELDGKDRIIMDDVLASFDHCRRILFRFSGLSPEELIAKGRDEDVEYLIDCHIRLYSVLDKFAKIIRTVSGLDCNLNGFWEIGEELKNNRNPYLKAISMIKEDLFPDKEAKMGNYEDPHLMYAQAYYQTSFIRNHIVHDAFRIADPGEENYIEAGVAALKAADLHYQTMTLAYTVREAIMLLQMAVEYGKREGGKPSH